MARSSSTQKELDDYRGEVGRRRSGKAQDAAVDRYAHDLDKRDAKRAATSGKK